MGGRQAGRVTRRVETAGIERCGKNTPRAAASRWVGGGQDLVLRLVKGERIEWEVKRQQDGQRYLSVHVETISQIWAMGDPVAHCPPDEMSDDRPTAAHVHTKGDPMDHTAGLGRGTLAGSRMHASFLLQNDCDLVPVQPRPRPAPVGHNKRELPARCLSHMPGRQGRQGYLRTENILVHFDSRAFPASRAPLPLASALPGLLFTS